MINGYAGAGIHNPVCDFCSTTPERPIPQRARWRYHADAFEVWMWEERIRWRSAPKGGPPGSSDWFACETCHSHIEAEDWEGLVEARAEGDNLPLYRKQIAGFRKARRGAPIRVLSRRFPSVLTPRACRCRSPR